VTEVDTYSKAELTSFTRARQLPILVIEDKAAVAAGGTDRHKQRFNLTNATAILSALESVRNDKHINFNNILTQYLPVLQSKAKFSTSNPFKYHVSNSELNSVEWRRWVNNAAIPAFKLNSVSNLKDLFETFNYYAKKSHWRARYSPVKYYYVYYTHALQTYFSAAELMEQV
jgi:hypothetical protein